MFSTSWTNLFLKQFFLYGFPTSQVRSSCSAGQNPTSYWLLQVSKWSNWWGEKKKEKENMQFAGHWMGIYMRQLRIFGFHSVSGRIHTFWDTIKWVRTHPLTELNCNIKRDLKLLLQVIIIYDLRYITIEFWRHTGYTLQANFTAEAFPTKL